MQSVRFVLRTVYTRLIRAKKQSVRFVIRTVCPRLINPYDLSTPNQGTPYNLSPYGLSEANQQSVRFVIRTVCLQTDNDNDNGRHELSERLLAPQSGALRISAYGDFQPNPNPIHL